MLHAEAELPDVFLEVLHRFVHLVEPSVYLLLQQQELLLKLVHLVFFLLRLEDPGGGALLSGGLVLYLELLLALLWLDHVYERLVGGDRLLPRELLLELLI